MARHRFLLALFAALILWVPPVSLGDEKAEQQAVKTFKQYVSDVVAHYKAGKHERIEHSNHCGLQMDYYLKSAYEVGEYRIDVRKTDSLLTPYIGVLELRWNERYSGCEETWDGAEAQSDLPHSDSWGYRYTYGFQEGKWVLKESELERKTYEGDVVWASCAKELAYTGKRMYDPPFGCTVK